MSEPSIWQPIETAPKGVQVLVYWPRVEIDDDGELTGRVLPETGVIGVSENTLGGWEEPDCLNAAGHYFDDNWEYGEPTHWHPLPEAPSTQSAANPLNKGGCSSTPADQNLDALASAGASGEEQSL